jgi:putative Holliday junction resolvase
VNEHKAGKLVVGLPMALSGEEGMQAEKVKAFVSCLELSLPVPVETFDERFSTVTAREYMRETGKKKDRFWKHDDAIAAAVILQNYLDENGVKHG